MCYSCFCVTFSSDIASLLLSVQYTASQHWTEYIESLGVSGLRSPMSGQIVKNFKWPYLSNASSDRLRVWFKFGFFSKDRLALFNLTAAHELHELYYDRPTS